MTDETAADRSVAADAGGHGPVAQGSRRPRPRVATDTLTGQANSIFFAAIETTRMPMTVTDPRQPGNPIVFANQAFLAMTGYRSEEILGRNCRFLQGDGTDAAAVAEISRAIAERREFATEILNYRKDGYSFWNALFISPIFDEANELIYFFGSQLDVSRRREAEDQLRHAQKMEALGRLTGGIAHDFNNLLQVMVGYLELIDVGIRKPAIDTAKLCRNVASAKASADRAAQLTQQLLAFARKQRLEGRTINLNALVDKLKAVAERTLGSDVAIETDLAADLPSCRVDPVQIETALLNVLINARDAMIGRPSKVLTVATRLIDVDRERTAEFGGLAAGRYVKIAVSDTGSGIAATMVERVMDPFFTTKEEGQGTGLGLAMVYGFARQSGGAATIASRDGEGTTVSICFPAVDADPAPQPEIKGQALDRPGDEAVLIVEDRRDVAELARTILQDCGYTTLVAHDARDALALIKGDHAIDLLFCDLIMPGTMNGVALAREAKSLRPALKILLTTGYAEASLERTEAGGREFDILNKPYGRSDLARKVRIVLDGPTGVS